MKSKSKTYTTEDILDDMAEFSGTGHYDETGAWVWTDDGPITAQSEQYAECWSGCTDPHCPYTHPKFVEKTSGQTERSDRA